jgi:primosomal protein N'
MVCFTGFQLGIPLLVIVYLYAITPPFIHGVSRGLANFSSDDDSLSKGDCNDPSLLRSHGGANPSESTFISKKMKMKMKKQMRKKTKTKKQMRMKMKKQMRMKMYLKKMKMRKHMRKKMKMKKQLRKKTKMKKQIKIKKEKKKRKKKKKVKTKWIRPAPRAVGLRPQSDSVVFPPHMRTVKIYIYIFFYKLTVTRTTARLHL